MWIHVAFSLSMYVYFVYRDLYVKSLFESLVENDCEKRWLEKFVNLHTQQTPKPLAQLPDEIPSEKKSFRNLIRVPP